MKKTILTALVALSSVALATTPIPPCVPTSGLQGYWSLDGGAALDDFGANNGTLNGCTPTLNRFGCPNMAMNFNGTSDFISVPYAAITGTASRAVCFWAKTTSTAHMAAVDWGSGNGGTYSSSFNHQCIGAVPDIGNSAVTYIAPINNGNWNFYVFQYSNSNTPNCNSIQVWMNGALLGPTCFNYQGGNLFNTAAASLYFGALTPGTSQFFSGDLDDIGIWNRVLTNAEISALYACTFACNTPTNSGGCCLGNYCNAPVNALTGNYQLSTAGNDFNFTDDAALVDKLNVGYLCGSPTIGKFNSHTAKQTNPTPVAGVSPFSAGAFGISQIAQNALNVGVMGQAENFSQDAEGFGVWGRAVVDGRRGVGVRGTSQWNNAGTNFGGSFFAEKGTFNIGVEGVATPVNGNLPMRSYLTSIPLGLNIGVYGACAAPNPVFPNAPATNDWAGWFDGDVNFVGNGYANTFWIFSDRRFKSKVTELGNVTEKINKLKGYTYEFNKGDFNKRNFPGGEQIGFIAQELKEVFPQLVIEDREGFFAVNYMGFIPVLLQAVKEQQQQIEELKALVNSLAGNTTAGQGTNGSNSIPVSLSDKNVLVLDQNVPNPFAESTVITYNIPDNFLKAQIIFSNNQGIVIKVVDILQKGQGTLNVFANDLTHGVYSYVLVIDGKIIDSKKMIKE